MARPAEVRRLLRDLRERRVSGGRRSVKAYRGVDLSGFPGLTTDRVADAPGVVLLDGDTSLADVSDRPVVGWDTPSDHARNQ